MNPQVEPRSREIGRWILGVGIVWMMVGMVVMPAGVSFNPGKSYQASLAVLLYLPALYLAFSQRARVWRQLWPLPAFRLFLLLLAWATLSLLWGRLPRPGDEFGRLLSVLAFVLGWQAYAADEPQRIRGLLLAAGLAIGVCAAFYCVTFVVTPVADGRIVGEGTIATANYAAALMGVVALWLSQLDLPERRWSWLRYGAMLALLLFVGLTHTRNIWLALCVTAVLMPLWRPGRGHRWLALGVLVIAMAAIFGLSALLTERGTSLRPELFQQSMHLIAQHPLLGLGQGVPFNLMVYGQSYTHTHNVLTQMMVELGLPGLLLLLALWVMVLREGWRHRETMQGRLVLTLWVYASVALQFDMPQLLDSPRPGWLLVWLPFALTLGLAWRERQAARTTPLQ
ncbi:O-antigen ligase [Dyella sp. C9]|uniref:O-antigen ligase family protein n=1 Tax=Dyella sp. C9 TaxID=2202154 RepID=UPI0013003233|nr:O-antigen ligase family protein [Dyella sp. C9]